MQKLPILSGKELVKILEKMGVSRKTKDLYYYYQIKKICKD
jgi:hypothetical protein